jgi:hypothetical protein
VGRVGESATQGEMTSFARPVTLSYNTRHALRA